MTAPTRGSLITAVFGLIFVLANAGSLPAPVAALLQGIAFAVFVAILLTLHRRSARQSAQLRPTGSAFGRSYWVVVAGEAGAIVVGLVALSGPLNAPQAAVAWISLVAGIHFLALAVVWKQPFFHALGAAIATCGAVGLLLAATGGSDAAIAATAGVLPGALLLAASLHASTSDSDSDTAHAPSA